MAELYKWSNGKKVPVSSKEAKAFIMKVNGWTSEQYRKRYDIFKNKLRAYESFVAHSGVEKKKQSPVEILYKQAKSKQLYGEDYQPSLALQRIERFSALSITKGRKALQSERYLKSRGEIFEETTNEAFEEFLQQNEKARLIANSIPDPVQREQALADFAEELHLKMKESGKVKADGSEFVKSKTIGSDEDIDFDITPYLED